ncbi:MAG: tetratricopeptide repeat protein [Candidatus Omnitrophota bacterium]|jgi:tetratricopeptide (TPR) repeat protein
MKKLTTLIIVATFLCINDAYSLPPNDILRPPLDGSRKVEEALKIQETTEKAKQISSKTNNKPFLPIIIASIIFVPFISIHPQASQDSLKLKNPTAIGQVIDPQAKKQVEDYYKKADAYYESGKYAEAIELFKKVIEIDSDYLDVYRKLGNAYAKLGNYIKAAETYNALGWQLSGLISFPVDKTEEIEAYKEAIRLDPKYYEAYCNLGTAYYIVSKYVEAIKVLKKAIELEPKKSIAYINLGAAYEASGKYAEAIKALEEARKLDPDSPYLHTMGLAYAGLENYTEAIKLYKEALAGYKRLPGFFSLLIHYDLGLAYNQVGKYSEAIESFKKAIKYSPKYAKAYYNMGLAYDKIDNHIEAVKSFRKAIELDPRLLKDVPEKFKKEIESDKGQSFNLKNISKEQLFGI